MGGKQSLILATSEVSRCLGSMIGMAIGDSIGSFLEFGTVTPESVVLAMKMCGEGPIHYSKGQVTDDTELAIALSRALAEGGGKFNANLIAKEYNAWVKSGNASVGGTCLRAMSQECPESGEWASAMHMNANNQSFGNGSLMRCVPLAIWGHKLPLNQLVSICQIDSGLSHPNPVCCDCVTAYIISCAHLINHERDAEGAYREALKWATEHANETTLSWLKRAWDDHDDGSEDRSSHSFNLQNAFMLAFKHLQNKTDFKTAMSQTVSLGGDTDTNAAIVGGMLGAYYGLENLPQDLVHNIETCIPEEVKRPEDYWGSNIRRLVEKLAYVAPTELIIDGDASWYHESE